MKNSIREVDMIFQKAQYLQRQGIEFELRGTNGRYELVSEYYGKSFVSKFKSSLTPKELTFIKKVKTHVKKNLDNLHYYDLLNHTLIQYVKTQKYDNGTVFDDVYEVDIDEAYWRTAKNKKIISEEIYNEGNKRSEYNKKVRLIALGSLAKKVFIYKFNGKRVTIEHDSVKRSLSTENLWYTICQEVSKIMLECSDLVINDFIMFWVDGIYFRGEHNVEKVQQLIESRGYECKIKKIHKVEYKNDTIFCTDDVEKPEESRSFRLPKRKLKKLPFPINEINKTAIKYSKFID